MSSGADVGGDVRFDRRPWARGEVFALINRWAATGERVLVGIDCAFALPFDGAAAYRAPPPAFLDGGAGAASCFVLLARRSAARPA